MKKMVLTAAIALSSFAAVKADTYDILNNDGSATRISITEDWSGHSTVGVTDVSKSQRDWEKSIVFIIKTITWLISD